MREAPAQAAPAVMRSLFEKTHRRVGGWGFRLIFEKARISIGLLKISTDLQKKNSPKFKI
jgi:hypothetical protein